MIHRKICVIVGAGASHDCWTKDYAGPGTSATYAINVMPLAGDLFNFSLHPEFADILNNYLGAKVIANEILAYMSRNSEGNFEKALQYFASHADDNLRKSFNHVPPYLRDLIHTAQGRFSVNPACYVNLVSELANTHDEVLFLVLNYDTLLETALWLYSSATYTFRQLSDYISPGRRGNVVKLHGSVNWFTTFDTHKELGRDELVRNLAPTPVSDSQIIVLEGISTVKRKQAENKWLYPRLTAPLAGKGQNAYVCPKEHIKFAEEFLAECRKFLVLGSSGLDEDLIHLLNRSIPSSDHVIVQVVGHQHGAAEALARFSSNVNAFNRTWGELPKVYDDGFSKYILSKEFKAFASTHL